MVNHFGGRGANLHCTDPLVLLQPGLHDDVLIRHDAGRLDGHRFRQLHDVLRRPDAPSRGELPRQWCVGGVTRGFPVAQPGEQVGLLPVGQRLVIGPMAGLSLLGPCREPRGHDTAFDRLTYRSGLSRHVVEGVERKRGRAAIAVTFHAARLQDARDPVMERDVRGCRRGLRQIQGATGCLRRGDEERASIDRGVDRQLQVFVARGVQRVLESILVIDGPAVDDGAPRIQHEDIGGVSRPHGAGHAAVVVANIRAGQTLGRDHRQNVIELVTGGGVHVEERHLSIGKLPFERRQRRSVFLADGAGGVRERDDHGRTIGEVAQSKGSTVDVGQVQVGDHAADSVVTGGEPLRALSQGGLGGRSRLGWSLCLCRDGS